MSKTLITGGAGFVGSNMAELIKPSILFDWRKPGYLFEGSEEELVYDDCNFVHGDVRNLKDLEKCSDYGEVGSIIHLAAIPGIKKCEEEPELAEEVNVEGTENVLEFARVNNIEKTVFASSAGVYGEIQKQPITEEHLIDPLNLYSKTKVEGEKVCRKYSEDYGLNVTVMRMSNLYGPNFQVKPDQTVIPLFILKALANQPLTIYGDGEQTRDFVHVKDVAQGFEKGLKNSEDSFQVFNLGTGNITSVNDLADIILEIMDELYDRDVEVKHVELPEWRNEAEETFDYSIEKIRNSLDYAPQYSLEAGVREILRNI